MAKKFSGLVEKMSPESRERIRQGVLKLRKEMALDELRQALSLTQEQLAETMGLRQGSVSEMIRGRDMYLSTLAKFVRAMGGELEIRVVFPTAETRLNLEQFSEAMKG
jgi:transcriptional regulator with XRE-family HTH domain